MGKQQFLRQIRSFEDLILKHTEKMEKEKAKPVPYDSVSPLPFFVPHFSPVIKKVLTVFL
ncbi:MAG: hypothetical protein B6D35_03750 [Candidatus Brocadia sp. UTAMX2]|jgi:hypothetical protein|nr:MAG: hypothetical protein B6D35_03750 [Candidatus Brocadia sp. UTAMX2]